MISEAQKRNNRRMALVLASVAAAFFAGVVAKMALFSS